MFHLVLFVLSLFGMPWHASMLRLNHMCCLFAIYRQLYTRSMLGRSTLKGVPLRARASF